MRQNSFVNDYGKAMQLPCLLTLEETLLTLREDLLTPIFWVIRRAFSSASRRGSCRAFPWITMKWFYLTCCPLLHVTD